MELISKQSKDIMGQELLVKMSVADLVILASVMAYQNEDELFEALHYSSQTCQSSEWSIYNGEDGVFEYMKKNEDTHYTNTYSKLRGLIEKVFNLPKAY